MTNYQLIETEGAPIKAWTAGVLIAAQADLVEVVHTLKQVLCVKG